MRRILFSLLLLVACATGAQAQVCNSASGFLKSFGTIPLGNTVILGPDCEHLEDGGSIATTFNNVKTFGAICDSITDDKLAIQLAANNSAALKKDLFIPAICLISGEVDISLVPRVFCFSPGSGFSGSGGGLISSSGTANLLKSTSVFPVLIENCTFRSIGVRTAGAGVLLTGNAAGNVIRNNVFTDQFRAIECDACITAEFSHNTFVNFVDHGIHIQNTSNPDSGDGFINHNLFNTSVVGNTVGVYQINSGGWNIHHNKFLPMATGVFLDRDSGAATGIYLIGDNSFDTQSGAGVVLQGTGSGTYEQINISDNIFSAQANCVRVLGGNANIIEVEISGGNCNYAATGMDLRAGNYINVHGVTFIAGAGNPPAISTQLSWPNFGNIGVNFYSNTSNTVVLNANPNIKVYPIQSFNVATSGGIPCYTSTINYTSSTLLTTGAVVLGGGAGGCPVSAGVATNGQVFIGQTGAAPLWQTASGDLTVSAAGAFTINNNAITLAKLATQAANTALVNATSGIAVPTAFNMPSCSTASSALTWRTNTGFDCNTTINASTLNNNTFQSPGTIGVTTPGLGIFTTLQLGTTAPAGNNIIDISVVGGIGRFLQVENSNGISQYGVDAGGAAYAWLASCPGGAGGSCGTNFGTAVAAQTDIYTNNIRRLRFAANATHLGPNGTAPALTVCGTSPAISGNDHSGTVTMGTAAPTGCVITFNSAYGAAPQCIVSWRVNLALMQYTVSTTALTLAQTATSSNLVDYTCWGQ